MNIIFVFIGIALIVIGIISLFAFSNDDCDEVCGFLGFVLFISGMLLITFFAPVDTNYEVKETKYVYTLNEDTQEVAYPNTCNVDNMTCMIDSTTFKVDKIEKREDNDEY